MNRDQFQLSVDQSVARFKHKLGGDSWARRVYEVLCWYEGLRRGTGGRQKAYRIWFRDSGKELQDRKQYREAEKLLGRFMAEVDPTGMEIESYMRWAFDYAILFFRTTKYPFLVQLYSARLMSAYLAWKLKGEGQVRVEHVQPGPANELDEDYRKILEPIWGEEWKEVSKAIIMI